MPKLCNITKKHFCCNLTDLNNFHETRTKTSIRYAKRNDREKERERKKGRRRYIEREGEIREREVKGIER